MKCPKCGYISFDYNQACPKCTKDISSEQQKMNLPPFRPDPPMLLGSLIGEADESQVIEASDSAEIGFQSDSMMTFDETGVGQSEEGSFNDSEAFEEGDMSHEDPGASEEEEIGLSDDQDLGLDLELDDAEGLEPSDDSAAKIAEEEVVTDFPLEDQDDSSEIVADEIDFEGLEDEEGLSVESQDRKETDGTADRAQEPAGEAPDFELASENEFDLDLDDIELDDSDREETTTQKAAEPEGGGLGDSSFPEEFTLEEQSVEKREAPGSSESTLTEEESSATTELKNIENALDLEDLDLDLELDEPDPQKST
ncbi:MAG: hypothetical protein JRJ29_19615 [Deltaproteobacteria bacterium]|nr:hypothetical protein [Deltaproteobacteria bacterium]